jgi:hypothetical protein
MTMPAAWMRVAGVVAASILALIALVIHEQLAVAGGTEITMAMQPVDPQALLSGNYVAIQLDEPLPIGQACPPGATSGVMPSTNLGTRPGHWVALAPRGGTWSAVGVATTREAALKLAPLVAQGDAYCVPSVPDTPGSVQTDLGVTRVSFSQAEAQRIADLAGRPAASGGGVVLALMSIGTDGKARMKGLVVNGQRTEIRWY